MQAVCLTCISVRLCPISVYKIVAYMQQFASDFKIMSSQEFVILIDKQDQEIGVMEKMEAHEKGLLHRAFSLFVFNDKQEMLLQRRALTKYHSGGLWTNACCSHPRPNEALIDAVKRRVQEEMGFSCLPQASFSFIYRAELEHNLIEHELDHVFFATYNDAPNINLDEVCEWKYVSVNAIRQEMSEKPELFTAWFKIVFEDVMKHFEKAF